MNGLRISKKTKLIRIVVGFPKLPEFFNDNVTTTTPVVSL